MNHSKKNAKPKTLPGECFFFQYINFKNHAPQYSINYVICCLVYEFVIFNHHLFLPFFVLNYMRSALSKIFTDNSIQFNSIQIKGFVNLIFHDNANALSDFTIAKLIFRFDTQADWYRQAEASKRVEDCPI